MANDSSNNKFPPNLKVPPLKIVLNSSNQSNAVVNIAITSTTTSTSTTTTTTTTTATATTTQHVDQSSNGPSEASNVGHQTDEINTSSRHLIEHKKFSLKHKQTLELDTQQANSDGDKPANKKGSKLATNNSQLQSDNLDSSTTKKRLLSSSSTSSASSSPSSFSILASSQSSGSDRSVTTTPSESQSQASNSTIISDSPQTSSNHIPPQSTTTSQGSLKTRSIHKDSTINDHSSNKQDKKFRSSHVERNTANHSSVADNKKATIINNETTTNEHQNLQHQQQVPNNDTLPATGSKEHQTLNANQRITRSSQRAAQQNKSDTVHGEPNGEEANSSENQSDKTQETARKAKRRKVETCETEPDGGQAQNQQAPVMADICPADYQLPTQNSFQLYRDIRERPHKKLQKLNSVKFKLPMGFKDYLLNGGPYLLDGNKLGLGLLGSKQGVNPTATAKDTRPAFKLPSRMKPPVNQSKVASQSKPDPPNPRHNSYTIPQMSDSPKSLAPGSALYELFQDQERARQQMRIQHLKERERFILTSEFEILRAYNKAAIANNRQELHLSACTYLYYQEKYHYLEDKFSRKQIVEQKDAHSDSQTDGITTLNREIFLDQLRDIDDKWDKIKRETLVRHKNEADGLHAVQLLEWEWKAKEVGACDVRVTPKIETELVPRIEIEVLDY